MSGEKKYRVVESRGLLPPGQFINLKEFDDLEEARAFLGEQVHAGSGRQFAILDEVGNMVVDESGKRRRL
jgi:hypothetical protein